MVRRIKDELIDTLDFRNKLEIAISDILILQVCFLKVKPKVNLTDEPTNDSTADLFYGKQKKSGETRPGFIAYLLSDRYPIQKIEIPNPKFEIPN